MTAFKQIFKLKKTPFLTSSVMDLLFNGVVIDCNVDEDEDLEAVVICPQLGSEKGVKKINDTYFSISILGDVSVIKFMNN
jgi:hypothetical protein